MSKYSFNVIDTDTTELVYKDKQFDIKKDVELTKEVQSIYNKARTKMMLDLTKEGITKKDLVIERKENGKTYYDNTNVIDLEKQYIEMQSIDLFQALSKKYFNMSLEEIISDIGLTEKETEQFGTDFANALNGKAKTPSEE